MVLPSLKILWCLLVPFAAGYALLGCLFRRTPVSLSLRAALSFLIGTGLLAQWMLLVHMMGMRLNPAWINGPLTAGSLILILLIRPRGVPAGSGTPPPAGNGGLSLVQVTKILMVLFIAVHSLYIVWRSLNIPVYGYDAVRISSLKAKMFFYDGDVSFRGNLAFRGYPLLVPLSQAWAALTFGQWDDRWVKIFGPFFYLSYLSVHYNFLKLETGRQTALLGLYLLLASPLFVFHATMPYMDFPLMTYLCGTVILLLTWDRTGEGAFIVTAGLLAGCAVFTKREGSAFWLICSGLLLLPLWGAGNGIKKRAMNCLKFVGPGLFVLAAFHLCLRWEGVRVVEDTFLQWTGRSWVRVPVILSQFSNELFLSGNWNVLWTFLGALLIFHRRRAFKERNTRLLAMVLFLSFGLYFFVFLTTTAFRWIDQSDAVLSRLVLHFYPLAPLLICLLLRQRKP